LNGFLPHLNDWNQKRKKIAELYLANIKNKNLSLLQVDKNVEPVWHLFPVLVSGSDRSSFQKFLSGQNIATGLHYPKLIQDQKALKDTGKYQVIGELTRANQFAQTEVSLPIHPFLEPQEIEHVIHVCNQWQP
jgi:dTDP-3-amino-3,4,6-trideoxy-alpha-D-glucose transaminase